MLLCASDAGYAYSFNGSEVIDGYMKDPNPLCYGWKDSSSNNESARARDSLVNSTDCDPITPVPNGQVMS